MFISTLTVLSWISSNLLISGCDVKPQTAYISDYTLTEAAKKPFIQKEEKVIYFSHSFLSLAGQAKLHQLYLLL